MVERVVRGPVRRRAGGAARAGFLGSAFTSGLLAGLTAALLGLAGCCSGGTAVSHPGMITSPTGLAYVTTTLGSGEAAAWGDAVTVHESTSHLDGRVIFSTWDTGQPITFTLGADQVVDGMEELVAGMRVGETREAVMPPAITRRTRYPESQNGEPPVFTKNDTLRFRVMLVGIGGA